MSDPCPFCGGNPVTKGGDNLWRAFQEELKKANDRIFTLERELTKYNKSKTKKELLAYKSATKEIWDALYAIIERLDLLP